MSLNYDYKRMLIVDLEATCWEDATNRAEQNTKNEIIQIGIVEINLAKKMITKEACYFVKPTLNPILSDFCTNLTGIKQSDVDQAHSLMKVSKIIRKEFSPLKIVWGAWGDDNLLVDRDCIRKNAVIPFSDNFYDFQELFALKKGASKRTKVSNAMLEYGLTFEGDAHNALTDARNTARLVLKML